MVEDFTDKNIGFFDSGVGGLTVFEKVKRLLPNENYLYFGDLKNSPYGEKSKSELIDIADGVFRFFEENNTKAVVMACNTTSANTYEELKDKYSFKIYPIIQSCSKIIADLPVKKIGVFATEATIKSGVYSKEIKKHSPDIKVLEMSCPQWVSIVEERRESEPMSSEIVANNLNRMLEFNPDKIILGCTHYPYLLPILQKLSKKDMFIDPSNYFAEFIKKDLESCNMLNNGTQGSERFFVSANPEQFKSAAEMFYSLQELPDLVNLF